MTRYLNGNSTEPGPLKAAGTSATALLYAVPLLLQRALNYGHPARLTNGMTRLWKQVTDKRNRTRPMRQILSLMVILTLSDFRANAQSGTITPTFSTNLDGNRIELTMEYNINYSGTLADKDTTQHRNVFEKYFGGSLTEQEKRALTIYGIKKELIKIISDNEHLALEPELPKDVLQIIELVKGKRKKEQARQIYIQNNREKLMTIAESTSQNISNGQFTKNIKVTYRCRIKVGKSGTLYLPPFILRYDDKIFEIKQLTIPL